MSTLLQDGEDVDAQGGKYESPLGAASSNDSTKVALMLIEHGANINITGRRYCTPLHCAVLNGSTGCAALLLERGALITADVENMTAMHYTVDLGSEKMTQVLLDAHVPIDITVKRKIWNEKWNGSQRVWNSEDDPNVVHTKKNLSGGLTVLHFAVLTGNAKMTRFLLDKGANPNALSEYGETPLHLALKRDLHGPGWNNRLGPVDYWKEPRSRIEYTLDVLDLYSDNDEEYIETQQWIESIRADILDVLLNHRTVNFNVKDVYGLALIHCVRYGSATSQNALTRLLEKGVQANLCNSLGQTGLHLACSNGDPKAIETLLAYGASILEVDNDGLNALHYAARSENQACIRMIFDAATRLQLSGIERTEDNQHRNALHHLFGGRGLPDLATVELLTKKGVDANVVSNEGYSPLAQCLRKFLMRSSHKAEIAGLLFQVGADHSFRTANGMTLGHWPAHANELGFELLQVLAQSGVELQSRDHEGRNILHHCAMYGSLETEEALDFLCSDAGLSTSDCDQYGKTPLDLACEMQQKERHPLLFRPDRHALTERLLRQREP